MICFSQIFSSQGQTLSGISKSLAVKVEEENEMKKDDGGQMEATSSSSCDPSLTEDQATSLPSSKLCTACTYQFLLIHIEVVHSRLTLCIKGAFSTLRISTLSHSTMQHKQECTHYLFMR